MGFCAKSVAAVHKLRYLFFEDKKFCKRKSYESNVLEKSEINMSQTPQYAVCFG